MLRNFFVCWISRITELHNLQPTDETYVTNEGVTKQVWHELNIQILNSKMHDRSIDKMTYFVLHSTNYVMEDKKLMDTDIFDGLRYKRN